MAIFYGDQGGAINDLFVDNVGSDDVFYTGEGLNIVFAGDGNDVIYTGSGNDQIDGGAGNDTIYAGEGNNTVFAGDGNDVIYTGSGNDQIRAGAGDDTIYAAEGNNKVFGGGGKDLIYTGSGHDEIDGGAGDDTIYAAEGNNKVFGGGGKDLIYTGSGSDYIESGAGSDYISASAGNDTIIGVDFTTFGKSEIDVLEGGSGNDLFVLGTAQKVFYDDGKANTNGASDYALIKGFNRYEDQIQLRGTKEDYTLCAAPEGTPAGVGVYFKNELIAIVQAPELNLDDSYFTFVEPAQTSITAVDRQSGFNEDSKRQNPLTSSVYDFTGKSYESLTTINHISVTLTLHDGDTGIHEMDFNNLTLGLDGIDTGIKLNDFFHGETITQTIRGIPNKAAQILNELQADGQLVGSVVDSTPRDKNTITIPFNFDTTLTITGLT
ncbi:Hemolysin-type calcium-binding region [Gloeocapsa sp. PCC 7428]|uniref:calcium-binding protein n=1 Tax=Gloeocapsa sp. PCC 7428 TaxID=1173026 RepID=UPI0002A60F50|nr:calcium-binding protein [Gloeocapsa sp. PCC 7428]AFZ29237.1 Hemolysin-type calcium-binding region [Gloeocapsa sp. PCC 7428]